MPTLPEDILALKSTVVGFDIATLLDAGLAEVDSHTFQPGIMQLIKWPLTTEFLILNLNHIIVIDSPL